MKVFKCGEFQCSQYWYIPETPRGVNDLLSNINKHIDVHFKSNLKLLGLTSGEGADDEPDKKADKYEGTTHWRRMNRWRSALGQAGLQQLSSAAAQPSSSSAAAQPSSAPPAAANAAPSLRTSARSNKGSRMNEILAQLLVASLREDSLHEPKEGDNEEAAPSDGSEAENELDDKDEDYEES